jgi:N-dimethylarginine dimethylaminohydrolase
MKRFLMCEPKFFDVCYVINPWMEGNLGKVNKELASVSLIEPVTGLPDMVFTANAGLVHKHEVIVSSFRHAERQPEAKLFERFFFSQGYSVKHLQRETIFEGAGDALFDTRGRLWVGSGIRSAPQALDEIVAVLKVEACGLLWVSAPDARNFACNAISIGQRVIMHEASAELKSALAQRGLEVIEAGVSEFLKSGGACKCLTLEI